MASLIENALVQAIEDQKVLFQNTNMNNVLVQAWLEEEQECCKVFHSVFNRGGLQLRDVERAVICYWDGVGRARSCR